MIADPAREIVYVGDTPSGNVVALSSITGNQQGILHLGDAVGGLALDHCYRQLFASVTGAARVDVIDCDTFQRTATIELGAPPYALTRGANGHLLVITSLGLLDLDPSTQTSTILLPQVEPTAFICSNRSEQWAFVAESESDGIKVSRLDLANPSAPPLTTPPGALTGRAVGVAISYAEDRIYVASSGADGVYVLDAATLAQVATIDVGPDVNAMCTNATTTRMYVAHGGLVIESLNLDTYEPGRTVMTSAPTQERGTVLAANNLSILAHDTGGAVTTYDLFDLRMQAPSAVRQGLDYTLKIDGTPNAPWYLLATMGPGYMYVDPPTDPDPRFFDLSPTMGLIVIGAGVFDGTGHAEITGTIPTDYTQEFDLFLQSAELPQPGHKFIVISNPLVVHFLPPTCP